ncbi:beta-ketoacyl synthase N-terminal-like domain-containing protein [Pseudomonas batumici]|uniref:BatB n=2 Tax=Pseudomonas TaxID=286 RepID=D4NZD7_PSEFL|nr:beta-ketoacyl synthase N-terminal-like domain-containing protein [Pseudomonas batumici]ADD82943.1 BatB [Pseudomonas fluorescens]KIH86008.1 BatB, batumin synthesis operon, 3-oxoacyl-(acyl-carrier-protein) synthase, KASII [Pseudomonas batumici]
MRRELVATGIGVISAIGQGKTTFVNALLEGVSAFDVMRRPGRQYESAYLGAEIREIEFPSSIPKQVQRAASLSAQAALVVLQEAWDEARLSEVDPCRIGLIVGGSNVQQRELILLHDRYRDNPEFLKPTYALSFMDSDLCGFCTAQFGIRGLSHTVGGASASGQLALIQASQAVLADQVDVCIALGGLMDLSFWECQAFRSLGAMGSDRYAHEPALACRPFDLDHDGFVFGECSGAVVIESRASSERRGVKAYAVLRGWGAEMDCNRNPDPSLEGEMAAIQSALQAADWAAEKVDYINPHGTGSIVGDETELKALHACGLSGAYLNATKSLIGHGLSAAGLVEVIATLLQMEFARLHPTLNLDNPIDSSFNWVRHRAFDHQIEQALTLSMGFGGINTALCWQRSR